MEHRYAVPSQGPAHQRAEPPPSFLAGFLVQGGTLAVHKGLAPADLNVVYAQPRQRLMEGEAEVTELGLRRERAGAGGATVRSIVRAMVGTSTLGAAGACVHNLLSLAMGEQDPDDAVRVGLVAAFTVLSAFCLSDAACTLVFLFDELDPLPPGLGATLLRCAGASAACAQELELIIQPVLSSVLIAAVLLTQSVEPGGDFGGRVAYPAAVSLTALSRVILTKMEEGVGLHPRAAARPVRGREATTVEVLPDEPPGPEDESGPRE